MADLVPGLLRGRGTGMHVGLNLIYLVPGETGGMEIYARALIPALRAAAPDLRLTLFVNQEVAGSGDPLSGELAPTVRVPVRARNRLQWVRGEQQLLPRLAARARVDVLHSLASTAPAWGRFRRVVTVHDLIYRRFPEGHFGMRTLGMRALVPLAARRSHRVIADSASTREDLVSLIGLRASKVDVVPLGVEGRPPVAVVQEADLRARHRLGDRPVVLSVSAKRPHKNLAGLIEGLSLIPAERRPVLVLPGYRTPHEAELRDRASELGVDDDVRFPGWISAGELEGLYAVARSFVFPSLYEGFGLPVLEAMQRGVPVACSDRSSLPEVVGSAALLFDPRRPEEIAQAIERLTTDREEAERLAAAGRARAALFTWAATARGTLRVYERVLAGRP